MEISTFATNHRLRRRTDECGDINVRGRRGTIDAYGSGKFAVTIMGAPTAQHWNTQRAALKAVGCRITPNGDTEGTALFDPDNLEQVEIALQAIRAYRKRKVTPEVIARLQEMARRRAKSDPGVSSEAEDGSKPEPGE